MLLNRLKAYAERLDTAPTGYKKTRIRWFIDLDKHGRFLGFVSTANSEDKSDRGKEFFAPHIGRTSGVKANLLVDSVAYVLGIPREKDEPAEDDNEQKTQKKLENIKKRPEAFQQRILECCQATEDISVLAILDFLKNLDLEEISLPVDLDENDNVSFRVEGQLPIETPSVQAYWAQEQSPAMKGATEMQCLVCGEKRPAVERLPLKIKGIPGGQSAGMSLISGNAEAFLSYGLKASLIAPTCSTCGDSFSKALNNLLQDERTRYRVGPLAYVFWTRGESTFNIHDFLDAPSEDEVKRLFHSASSGNQSETFDETPFYSAAMSASGARVAVRSWLETTVGGVKEHLGTFFRRQMITNPDGSRVKPLSLYQLATAVIRQSKDPSKKLKNRDVEKKLPPMVPNQILDCALRGIPPPLSLLFQAVGRCRAEQGVKQSRAALIKLVVLSHSNDQRSYKEDSLTELELENTEPAYLCGRLLAVLESVQRAALGKVNASITDRYYGTASSAPASVFGRLLRGAQGHLSKLRKNEKTKGAYLALQVRLEQVQSGLQGFPRTLDLVEQGLFGLGYYHQRASDRAGAIAHKKEKENS